MNLVRCKQCNREFDSEIAGIVGFVMLGIEMIAEYFCSVECQAAAR